MIPFTKEEIKSLRNFRKSVGVNIRKTRMKKGLTLEQLSALTGVSTKRLEDFEAGKREITFPLLVKITSALAAKGQA